MCSSSHLLVQPLGDVVEDTIGELTVATALGKNIH